MSHIRNVSVVIAGLSLSVLVALAVAPAAFAMRVVPPTGGQGSSPPAYIVTQSGMAGWEITLIAVGTALAGAAITALVMRNRVRSGVHAIAG